MWLFGCVAVKLCVAVWLCGCVAVWLCGCVAVWLWLWLWLCCDVAGPVTGCNTQDLKLSEVTESLQRGEGGCALVL